MMNAPQQRHGPRKAILAVMTLVAVSMVGFWWTSRDQPAEAKRPAPLVPVQVTRVQRQDIAHYGTGIGHVQALQHVNVRPLIDGQLMEIAVKEGQAVRRGDLLALMDDRAIRAALTLAEAEKARVEAQLASARLELARSVDLSGRGAVARQTREQQELLVAELAASVKAMEATIVAERVQLSHTRITSPIDGRVGLRNADPGNVVRTSDTNGLFTVTRSDRVTVVFSLSQRYAPALGSLLTQRQAAPAEVFENDGGRLLAKGQVTAVDPVIDSQTGSVRLKAEFDNREGTLWPGQLVSVRVQTGMSQQALTVPAGAVRLGPEHPFVYRVRDGKADMVSVNRVQDAGDLAVIEGVTEGDVIVTDGFPRLKTGVSVAILGQPGTIPPGGQESEPVAPGVSP